jgi:glycerol uptake facilitator-like aquaporin
VPQGFSHKDRATGAHFVSELVATAVLIVLIFALARTHRGALAAPAVGAVVAAGYFFTSSTFFADIAADVPRMFSDTFAGIEPASVPAFAGAQLLGLLAGVVAVRVPYPDVATVADDVVVPHTDHYEVPPHLRSAPAPPTASTPRGRQPCPIGPAFCSCASTTPAALR